jgi:hypothetical protein
MAAVRWTSDGLSDPEETRVEGRAAGDGFTYDLVHDLSPVRWYIVRRPVGGGERERTVVYGSPNAPALRAAWNRLKGQSA